MTDRRLFPANERVADRSVKDQVSGLTIVDGTLHTIKQPVVNLMSAPDGSLERQLLFGAAVEVLEVHNGYAFLRHVADGYVGYVGAQKFRDHIAPTHRVSAPAAQIYPRAHIKSTPFMTLPFQAELAVASTRRGFAQLATGGFVPEQLIAPLDVLEADPVAVAERFLGVPYLWGGNSIWGLDCSGLVQAACRAAGIACPADSDMQAQDLGAELDEATPLLRGDLVFWKGHVGLMQDADRIIHANAHHMTVTSEKFAKVCARIENNGDGSVTGRRRLP